MCIRDSIWARAHMGQGPYGPGPIWAKAHMGQGPYGPRAPGPRALPCWANTSPKNAPWKKESKLCFLAAVSRRDLCYVSENKGFRFAKNKLIHAESSFIAHRSRAHFCFMKFIPINVLVPCEKIVGVIGREALQEEHHLMFHMPQYNL